ncbi:MAG: hypothetical protein Kow0026_17800 [Oricola sp.]
MDAAASGAGNRRGGDGNRARIAIVFAVSLVFQVIQVGAFPIYLSQKMLGLGFESWVIGLCAAISWLTILALGPVIPRTLRLLGYRWATALSVLLTAAGLALIALSGALAAIAAAAIAVGAGLILRWIAFDALVVEIASETRRGSTVGLHEALMGFGIALGPLFFVVLPLYAVPLACIAFALLALAAFQSVACPPPARPGGDADRSDRLKIVRLLAPALLAAFVAGSVESAGIALFPVHFQYLGFPLSRAAILVTAFGLGGTLLQPPLGTVADKAGYRPAHGLCILVVVASGLALVAFPASFEVTAAAIFLLGGAAGGFNTLAVIEAGTRMGSAEIPAAMTAIAMAYTVGGVTGPVISGAVLEIASNQGMVWTFVLMAAVLGVLMFGRGRAAPRA